MLTERGEELRLAIDAGDLPKSWYNIIPDIGVTVPPPMSRSGYPITTHDLENLLSQSLIQQELDRSSRQVTIPEPVRNLYAEWRPTPLCRAERLEKELATPARIFYKNEGVSPSGGHEMNTAIAQAYFAAQDKKVKRLVTATGNGEWGISIAIACNYFGLDCTVYMTRSSYDHRPYGRSVIEILGARVLPSPSENTRTGKKTLSGNPESPGTLGIALSEAFEDASMHEDTKFCWGTVMNHVILHNSVIGLETRSQMKKAGVKPDILISSVGGGSAFGGLAFPFFAGRDENTRFIAVETAAAPSLSKGRYAYDFGDSEGLTPQLKMYTLGHSYVPPGIRAGGMRYHGISPLISALYHEKRIEARAYEQRQALEAGVLFAKKEGLIPSPETCYALKAVVDEARACKERKEQKNILFVLVSNSNLDVAVFDEFVHGALVDQPFPEDAVQSALDDLPQLAVQ